MPPQAESLHERHGEVGCVRPFVAAIEKYPAVVRSRPHARGVMPGVRANTRRGAGAGRRACIAGAGVDGVAGHVAA